jgi:hypothetical protein
LTSLIPQKHQDGQAPDVTERHIGADLYPAWRGRGVASTVGSCDAGST